MVGVSAGSCQCSDRGHVIETAKCLKRSFTITADARNKCTSRIQKEITRRSRWMLRDLLPEQLTNGQQITKRVSSMEVGTDKLAIAHRSEVIRLHFNNCATALATRIIVFHSYLPAAVFKTV